MTSATEAPTRTPLSAVQLRYPVNALVSYHYAQKWDVRALAAGGLRLVGDSGAFSALTQGTPIDRDAYADWTQANRQALCWSASLDVIGDPEGTWRNWQYLTRLGDPYVPTIHYGTAPTDLDRYADAGVDFVGLGGMVARKSEVDKLLRWCVQVFRYARDRHPGMVFHGWGVTHPKLLNSLPWFSVDSSGWGGSYRFGRLRLWDQQLRTFQAIQLDGREVHDHTALLRQYGVAPADVARSHGANRPLVVRLSAASFQRFEDRLRERVTVPAPSYGVRDQTAGPNLHLADTGVSNLLAMSRQDGPHVHLADARQGNLLDLARITPPPFKEPS